MTMRETAGSKTVVLHLQLGKIRPINVGMQRHLNQSTEAGVMIESIPEIVAG